MAKRKRGRDLKRWKSGIPEPQQGKLRIIGGRFGGQQIAYSGDPVTRPMKDNIREAVFNLVGGWVPGKYAFDLFAGTGAIGLEAISRGAIGATLIERHVPTVKIINENVKALQVEELVQVETSDTFFWARQFFKTQGDANLQTPWSDAGWIVFCCPPYELYVSELGKIVAMITAFLEAMPRNSMLVVESDHRFQPEQLPSAEQWSVREYSPATISIWHDKSHDNEHEVDEDGA